LLFLPSCLAATSVAGGCSMFRSALSRQWAHRYLVDLVAAVLVPREKEKLYLDSLNVEPKPIAKDASVKYASCSMRPGKKLTGSGWRVICATMSTGGRRRHCRSDDVRRQITKGRMTDCALSIGIAK